MFSQETINIEDAFEMQDAVFLDVRSEGEFAEDHILGAINLPIFDDKERAEVGIVYKEQGIEEAKKVGLKIAGPKLPYIYEQVLSWKDKNIIVYCWRGGMRSKSVQKVLQILGLRVFRIEGGYKSYRRYVNDFFENTFSLEVVVFHGLTGVGKTEIIKELMEKKLNAVDLENLANNRGSVYGNVALLDQPTQKLFESKLFVELWQMRKEKYVIMECESRRIGKVFLPTKLHKKMQSEKHLLCYDTMSNRIQRIISEYTQFASNDDVIKQLLDSTSLLQKRLGKNVVQELHELIKTKNFAPVIEYLLINYYDPLYKYPDCPSDQYDASLFIGDKKSAFETIYNFIEKQYMT